MSAHLDPHTVAALLRWHVDAGVDWAVDDEAHDRFAESALLSARREAALGDEAQRRLQRQAPLPKAPLPHAQDPNQRMPAAPQRAASLAPSEAAENARAAAAGARSLAELRDLLESFDGCALKATATRLVFADGNPQGGLMLVGEAPGADEDRQGKPFVGRAGRLLDKMLAAIGLDRNDAYIANIVPWRPPGNRTPTPQETAICLPFIQRQIELAAPRILVTLGGPSTQTLLGVKDGILRTRGRWSACVIAGREIPTMPTLHPAYLLRQPGQKRLAWRDLQAIRKAFDKGRAKN